ncbi:MAG: hypothetical protein AMJ75_01960 [Phycisphaerae bacterium SM1_79]|nr:MAG: hypothetical protein AMJ75_01960 [Phycisphaerae bacterium SM1_79]
MLTKKSTLNLRVLLIAASFAFLTYCHACYASQESPSKWTREAIARWLRHQESIVRSIECTFESKPLLTRPENIPLIDQVCRQLGKKNRYIYTEQIVKANSFVVHWLRKGAKERWDTFELTDTDSRDIPRTPSRSRAFDGHLVRDLELHDKGPIGSIETIEGAHWHSTNLPDPYSFLYEFQATPYSKIVAEGSNFDMSVVVRDGRELIQVSVDHPSLDSKSFVLLFDDKHRLIERQYISQISPDPAPRLCERHVFSNYKKYKDESGELIWFPQNAVYHHYMGNLSDGTPVEYTANTMTIREIRFNVDIPDEEFLIEFPPGTEIWDGVAGLGWVQAMGEIAQDEGLSDLLEGTAPSRTKLSEASAKREKQNAGVSADDQVVPASDKPQIYSNKLANTRSWWPFAGLFVPLVFLLGGMIWWSRRKKAS